MNHYVKTAILVCAALMASSTLTFAELYKWVDEKGKTIYSDQPPPADIKDQKTLKSGNTKYVTENTPVATDNASKPNTPKTLADKEMEFRKRQVEKEDAQAKAAKEEADAKLHREKCAQARGALQSLQGGGRITKYNDKGELVYLEDNERQREIDEAKKAVASFCK